MTVIADFDSKSRREAYKSTAICTREQSKTNIQRLVLDLQRRIQKENKRAKQWLG